MNNYILYNNVVEWNNMKICYKKNVDDIQKLPNKKCDFENDNCIPECIYKGPNTAVHLCLVNIKDILKAIHPIKNETTEITNKSVIMKTCVILVFVKNNLSIKTLDIMDTKLQSIRQIEINEKKINKWKKDNNYVKNAPKYTTQLKRHYTPGYISKHGKHTLPISFREIEILSSPLIKKELLKHNDKKLLMILEHRKENSKPYGSWDYSSIGGGFIYGETPIECIIRETYEESGLLLDESSIISLAKIELPSNPMLDIENSNTLHIFKTFL